MLRSIFLCSLFLALAFANTAGKFLVMNATPDTKFSQKRSLIDTQNIAGLIGHLMGVYGPSLPQENLPSNNFFTQPKANLLVVIDGASSSEDLADQAIYDVNFNAAEVGSTLVSKLVSDSISGPEYQPTSLGDLLCQINQNSAVLSLSTNSAMLNAVAVPSSTLQAKPAANVFGAHFDVKTSKFTFTGKSSSKLQAALQTLFTVEGLQKYNPLVDGEDVFDEYVQEEKLFLVELKALSNLLSTLKQPEIAALLKDNAPDLITFLSASLKGLREKHGESSDKYITAWNLMKGVITQIQSEFSEAFENQAIFEVLLLNSQQPLNRARRSVQKRNYDSLSGTCYSTFEECSNATQNCSGNGFCGIAKQTPEKKCFRCRCDSQHAGDVCEFIDIVAPFHIIFWMSLTLLIALVIVSTSLAFMDPGTDTLLFRTVVPKAKRE